MDLFNLDKALEEFRKKGVVVEVLNKVKSGKEAMVYRVKVGEQVLALKLYKNHELRSFKDVGDYVAGKYIQKPSLRKAVRLGTGVGKKYLQERWVSREFYLLNKLHELGASIPKPFDSVSDAILMEYLGSDFEAAPILNDIELEEDLARKTFEKIVSNMKIFLEMGIIHSDLSPYNILWWHDKPYIIDFPQAANIKENSNAEELLRRDVHNVCVYFGKYFEIDENEVYTKLIA